MKKMIYLALSSLLFSNSYAGGTLSDIFPTTAPSPTPIVTIKPTPDPAIQNILNIMECLKFPVGTYVIVITPQTPKPTIIKH